MEFYQELLLTAVFSVLIAFLIGKIAVVGASDGERTEDAPISADRVASTSTGEKSEASAPKESEASADRSGTEEELLCSRRDNYGVAMEERGGQEKSATGTGMVRVEEVVTAKMPEIAEILRDFGHVFQEEEEREVERSSGEERIVHVEGTEINVKRGSEGDIEDEGSLLHGEDEWEGIEKSELEKLFGVATEYVRSSSGAVALARLSSDVQMELYGLYKTATEGPCYESQPLPLNFSGRAKWQAWQRLGNMSPEVAMEHYICLLSKNIPGWMEVNSGEDAKCDKGNDSPVAGISDSDLPDLRLSLQSQLSSETQRKSEDLAHIIDHSTDGSKILEQGFTSTFILNLLSPTRGAFLSIYW